MKAVVQQRTPVLCEPGPHAHIVELYQDDEKLAASVGVFLLEGIARGEGLIVVATPEHWSRFARVLQEQVDLVAIEERGQLVRLDAESTLTELTPRGLPDRARFDNVVGGALEALRLRGFTRVRAYGEMVDLLWQRGNVGAAVALETFWNQAISERHFPLFCAYRVDLLGAAGHTAALDAVCRAHTHTLTAHEPRRLESAVDQAFTEVIGADRARALRVLITETLRPSGPAAGPEHIVLWVRKNLPALAPAFLTRIRFHYDLA